MPAMPARYTSARFVGREDAFAKLATVIRSSAAGESATLLIDGTAGVGTSRFIDEAIRRVSGSLFGCISRTTFGWRAFYRGFARS